MELPSALARSLTSFPPSVVDPWLDALPDRIADAERRWSIRIDRPFEPGGVTSFVAPATSVSGASVVYKLTVPHDEAVGEAEALDAYDGDGSVRLLAANAEANELLLERAQPGTDLWSEADDVERLRIGCSIMRRLWRPAEPGPIAAAADVCRRWAAITERRLITNEVPWVTSPIERGIELLRSLPATTADPVLVHGDFHPGNVLAATRERWLAIDPKPLVGDRAFDAVQLLTQRAGRIAEPGAPEDVEGRLSTLATLLGLEPERVGYWAIARTAEWSMWSWEHGDTVDAAIAYTWARTLDHVLA